MKLGVKNYGNKGIILIEAILALAVIAVIMTALVTALVSSVSSSNFSKDQSLATSYAQEGIEIARNDKDANFETFQTLAGTYCLFNESSISLGTITSDSNPTCPQRINNKFTRTVYINQSGRDTRSGGGPECETTESAFVAATVFWSDSKCNGINCHKVELNSCFVNLNRVDAF